MKNLIVYATKYGCTEKAARLLKTKLGEQADLVDVMKEKVPALDAYDTVMLGGSIYMGQVQKELLCYINGNLPSLLKKKIGLFLCAGSPDPAARVKELETVFPAELYTHAAAKELFGFEIQFDKMGFFDKLITKAMKGDKNNVHELNEVAIGNFARTMA